MDTKNLFFVTIYTMNYYSFEYPFLILLLLPILYCLYKCRELLKERYFVHLHLMSAKKSFFKIEWIVKVLVFVLLVIALCSPVMIDRSHPFNREGRDIVLALDASGSMNASGFAKVDDLFEDSKLQTTRMSRFDITKKIASEFIVKRAGDNVGVVVYGDFAFIATPVTYEKDVVVEMLSYLTQGMAGQNTAIGEAVAMGVRALKHSKAKTKVIILLSDGEHNSGSISPKESVALAKSKNIKIYTIAIGDDNEADSELLKSIAKDTQGKFFSATSAKELQSVYDAIDKLESSKIRSKEYVFKEYYYQIFLLLALALLAFLIVRGVGR